MPGCWQDWNGLEEVTEVTAFWGEGIGRNSHTLELQEVDGLFFALGGSAPADPSNKLASGLPIDNLASSEKLDARLPLPEKALWG